MASVDTRDTSSSLYSYTGNWLNVNYCIFQNVQTQLTGLSSEYSPLIEEVNKALQQDDIVVPSADTVRDESSKLVEKWDNLNESTGLFYAK